MRSTLKIVAMCLVLAALVTGYAAATGEQQGGGASADEVPVVHYYQPQTNAAGAELGSDPGVLAAVQDYIEEQTGVRPVNHYLSNQDYTTALNLVLSSDEQVDWFYVNPWSDYYTKNVIQPINEYLELAPTAVATWPESSWNAITDSDGNIWGLPRATPTTPFYVHVRADWLDQLGLDMPTNVAELEDVMAAFKEAELGGANTTVLQFSNGLRALRMAFLANWNEYGDSMFLDSDGMVKPYALSDGFDEWLVKMADWYQLGYLDQESFVNAGATRARYQQLRPGVFAGWYSHVTISNEVLSETDPDARYEIAQMRGPDGDGIMTVNGAKPTNGHAFHVRNSNPEATMSMIEWFYQDMSNYLVGEWGLEGQQWEWIDEENGVYRPIGDRVFFNEFRYSIGLPMEGRVLAEGGFVMHNAYLRNRLRDYDLAVFPWDTPFQWDAAAVQDNIPGMSDINRLLDEEVTKFIMGARPLSEADEFVEELYAAGLDDWIAEHTRQYNTLR